MGIKATQQHLRRTPFIAWLAWVFIKKKKNRAHRMRQLCMLEPEKACKPLYGFRLVEVRQLDARWVYIFLEEANDFARRR